MKGLVTNALVLTMLASVGYCAYSPQHVSQSDNLLVESKDTAPMWHGAKASTKQPTNHAVTIRASDPAIRTDQLLHRESLVDPSKDTDASSKVLSESERKAEIFGEAAQLVDQMIANHQISQDQLLRAIALLRDSDQESRSMELGTRILLAIERGELTQQQAGIIVSPSTWVEVSAE